jgi:hypothetical protein
MWITDNTWQQNEKGAEMSPKMTCEPYEAETPGKYLKGVVAVCLAAILLFLVSGCGGSAGAGSGNENGTGSEVEDDDWGDDSDDNWGDDSDDNWGDESDEEVLHFVLQRVTVGMQSATSMECYTFYPDGTVELRHGGTADVTDHGLYEGDSEGGEIVWDSGRVTSVEWVGDAYKFDSVKGSEIDSCY